jgi:CheY-like chemotaxis protein/anti-sigma regulatory factor (Ser/Thr protein kinase)
VLRGLFDNLLDLSRFDSGEIRVRRRIVSLREMLVPIAVEHEVVCRAKGLEWQCDIADGWVETDPELVRRIVANLLSNAVRYTERGSVSLKTRLVDGDYRLTVADTGVGIAPEDQARVFEEFVQLDNPSRERDRGVGLGLSIVRKISALLGANLQLDSAAGQGTRVSIDMPVAQAHVAEVPQPPVAEAPAAELAGMRLWVVEDDPLVRDALAKQFDAWGVDHAFALDRSEVERLREADGDWPDAVMLDDMLGRGERGLDIARWLEARMPRERLVIVTGNVQPAALEDLRASGFAVLQKPLASAVIAQWLHGVVRDRAALREGRVGAPAG